MNWDAWYKTISTLLGATVGWLYGGWDPLLQVLLTFAIIDYGTGLLASGVEGKLSSKIGFRGISKKITIFLLVAAGHLVDVTIGKGSMIQDAITFFYLGNELLSITENAGRIGLPVPTQIKNAVQILKGKGEGK
jgi:toxin secretion/phage lysis holin